MSSSCKAACLAAGSNIFQESKGRGCNLRADMEFASNARNGRVNQGINVRVDKTNLFAKLKYTSYG